MLTIIDYNLGSADKVADALTASGIRFKITRNENDIIGSEKIITFRIRGSFASRKKTSPA